MLEAEFSPDLRAAVARALPAYRQALIEICEIPAPPFDEERRASDVARRMAELALDVSRDDEGNVIGRLAGQDRQARLVVNAHLDTVFERDVPIHVIEKEGRLFAPGISDNSASLAALLMLVPLARQLASPLPFDVIFLANVGEEGLGNLRGMRRFFSQYSARDDVQIQADLVIDGVLGKVTPRGIGVRRLKLTYETAGGHSWLDYGASSAVHSLAQALARALAIPVPSQCKTTFNAAQVQGGTAINAIAAQASTWLDLRSEDPIVLDEYTRSVLGAFEAEAARTGVNLRTELLGERPAGGIPNEHALVKLAQRTAAKLHLDCIVRSGSTDANIPLSLGIPSLAFGITDGTRQHTLYESLGTASLEPGLLFAAEMLLQTIRWIAIESPAGI
jgi:acetylornithine deacetylase/succinyl-diaminopimelate desuccinylase-like protein